jgi:hypothetical protein
VPPQALFGISVALGFLAWGIVAAGYLWPYLRSQPRVEALRPLLVLHSFRFVGLAFLVPGVVAPDLSAAFARPAAYGDLIAAVLALLALASLQKRWGMPLVWVFNLWAPPISSTLSIRETPSGSLRVSWVPPTSFQPSSYRCS